MNKKGFTLVELLAVIAVLAILVVFAIPNVVKMFEKSKKENFLNEVKTIYNEAAKKYLSEAMNGNSAICYCSDGTTKLDINASGDLKYCVEVDDDGKVISIVVSNGKYMIDTGEIDIKSLTSNSIKDAPYGGILSNVCIERIDQNATGPILSKLFNSSDTVNFGVYTGEHNDTYGFEGNEPIIYFNTNTNNNVIFADHCWQMIRTTSSGGVRLIYNGKQVNNKCEDRGNNNVGYSVETKVTFDSSYYYADDYDFDGTNFSLVNPIQETWSDSTKDNLIGKYACKISNGICSDNLYLVSRYKSNTQGYVMPIIKTSHYSQFGILQFNYYSNSPAYAGYMYGTVYPYKTIPEANVPEFRPEISSYSNGKYTLSGPVGDVDPWTHYFCIDATCTKVGYVYKKREEKLYYLELNGEANIDEVLANMLDNNINDSTIKTGIDAWYKKYLLKENYNDFIEQNAIYCNRRDIQSLGSFEPNGGVLTDDLYFVDGFSSNTNLNCSDINDQFSIANSNALLNYPIGLMTYPEAIIIGKNVRNSGRDYWLGSAYYFNYGAPYERYVKSSGGLSSDDVNDLVKAVRPVISIRLGVKVEAVGDGTVGNPYVID